MDDQALTITHYLPPVASSSSSATSPESEEPTFHEHIQRYFGADDGTLASEAEAIAELIIENKILLKIPTTRDELINYDETLRGDVEQLVNRVAPLSTNTKIQQLRHRWEEFNAPFIARGELPYWRQRANDTWRKFVHHFPQQALNVVAHHPLLLETDVGTGAEAVTLNPGVTIVDNYQAVMGFGEGIAAPAERITTQARALAEWCNHQGIAIGPLTHHGLTRTFLLEMVPFLDRLDFTGCSWFADPEQDCLRLIHRINEKRSRLPPIPIRFPEGALISHDAIILLAPQLESMVIETKLVPEIAGVNKVGTACQYLQRAKRLTELRYGGPYTAELQEIVRSLPLEKLHLINGTIQTPIDLSSHRTLKEVTIEHCVWDELESYSTEGSSDESDLIKQVVDLSGCSQLETLVIENCVGFTGSAITDACDKLKVQAITLWSFDELFLDEMEELNLGSSDLEGGSSASSG